MAYAAVQNRLPLECWVLLGANVFWAVAYDTEYAMVDRDDDIHLGIHSSALLLGKFDVLAVMVCYAVALTVLAVTGMGLQMSAAYYAGLLLAAGVAVYHYTLIRHRQRETCFKAFLHNNWFGAAIFGGIVLNSLLQ